LTKCFLLRWDIPRHIRK